MDLLTMYIRDSELQAIAVLPLISTNHESPQHPLSLFLVCAFISYSLAAGPNGEDPSDSRAQVLSSQPSVQNSESGLLCHVAQAVSRWIPHRVGPDSRLGSMWSLWWTKRHWSRFSPSTSVSSANHHSINFSIIIITQG
jgi:hypothetical protein